MEELIWFSMPGAVMAAAIAAVWPSTVDSESKIVVWVVVVPVIGFIVHQLYRLLFETTGGYARESRTVLQYISNVLAPRENLTVPGPIKAFLIWEITFYSDDFPESFREHDRRMWHYILSFWSITLSATLSMSLCLIGYLVMSRSNSILLVAGAELIVAIVFYFKGRSSYQSLVRQETAMAHNHESIFLATLRKLEDLK